MFLRDFLHGVRWAERELERLLDQCHESHPHHAHRSRFNFFIHNLKISFTMGNLKVPSGTPVSGTGSPLDAKGNKLKVSAFKPGSVKFSTADSAFTIGAGATEEDFTIVETTPGAASLGTLLLDAQDKDGNQLPQSSAVIEFTAVEPVAVASQIDFDQTSH